MAAITQPLAPPQPPLRPFDVRRDLNDVANLVETCFADTLDRDGRRYIQQMHAAARNPNYLTWASSLAERVPMPLSGYVWEEKGVLAGNLSLIPFTYQERKCYLIANVAVDPAYRKRGIASALTRAALEHARQRGAASVWLHVRVENQAAIRLYQGAGFMERTRRTTWEREATSPDDLFFLNARRDPAIQIQPQAARVWPLQRRWLLQNYPPEITWHLPFHFPSFQPGLLGFLHRLLKGIRLQQVVAYRGQELLGILGWQPSLGGADHLWISAPQESEDQAVRALLPYLLRRQAYRRRILIDYPAGRLFQALHEAGFHIQQTLIWMEVVL